jgi:hypothetical protein
MEAQTKNRIERPLLLGAIFVKIIDYYNPKRKVFERIFFRDYDGFIVSDKIAIFSNEKDTLRIMDPTIFKEGRMDSISGLVFINKNGNLSVDYDLLYDPHLEIKKLCGLIKFWNCPTQSENWKEINDWVEFNPGENFQKEYDEVEFPSMWEGQRYNVITRLGNKHLAKVEYDFFPSVQWCILNEKVPKTEIIIAWKLWQPL